MERETILRPFPLQKALLQRDGDHSGDRTEGRHHNRTKTDPHALHRRLKGGSTREVLA